MAELAIRSADVGDADAIWAIFRQVVAAGDTYVYDPDISRDEALATWLDAAGWCYVATEDDRVIGTYVMKANQQGLGSHVANAGFMVDPAAQGQGSVAGWPSTRSRRRGDSASGRCSSTSSFRPTSPRSRCGASSASRSSGVPGAFHLRRERYVDALVMYRSLV